MPMPFGLPPADPAVQLFVASQGMTQGVLQSEGPQVIPRAYLKLGEIQVGALWRNIDSPAAKGIAVMFGKYVSARGPTQFEGAVLYRMRTGARRPTARHAWEFDATARRTFGKLALRFNAEYAPRDFELGPSLFVETGSSYQIANGTQLYANVGRRVRSGAPGYAAVNVGVSRTIGKALVIEGRFYATNKSYVGPRYHSRFVLGARLSL